MEKVDNLDRKILNLVMNNARMPSKEIADICGVSRAAIHQRLQRLIELKVITGSGYNVNPQELGYNTCTYIGIRLEKGSMYRETLRQLLTFPEVVECHFTTGPYSMLVKVYAHDAAHLMELLNDRIQSIVGVTATETLISLEQGINRQLQLELDESSKHYE
ncbi:MAG: Lrp/AsnC ligand binding domain-containing protein [Muribaculaceae bacterium]|nr:Lrp/AsnC ligand binding domain-containing protein [Muribaculaceae bacterium]